ncbi:MAG: pirin family protein [Gammaproteobacteria bacterium]|nr:MAG: pirin family protein [Gammaproteobacteria bacterium]
MTHIRYQSVQTREGDNAEVRRLFPLPGRLMNYDPFVLWDDFTVRPGAGFPTHPHRGFEAVTYLFSGEMQHRDNLGNHSTVGPGGAQRFTAGSGIEHSEMPGDEADARGIQLWVNLPLRLKQLDPGYQEIPATEIPQQDIDGGYVRTIVGKGSPLRLHTDVHYLEVVLGDNAEYGNTVDETHQGFIYLVAGDATLGDTQLEAGDACFLETGNIWQIQSQSGCRLMVCTGTPHREPIRQHGTFVD